MTTQTTDNSIAELITLAGFTPEELQAAGLNEGQITLRLARTLAGKGHSLDFLPTSGHGAAIDVLFSQLTLVAERIELGELIMRRDGLNPETDMWPEWLHRALEDAENADRIDHLRHQLTKALAEAAAAIANVNRTREQLITAYDIEHTESGSGDLFGYYLAKAGRAINTAAAVNPTRTEGK